MGKKPKDNIETKKERGERRKRLIVMPKLELSAPQSNYLCVIFAFFAECKLHDGLHAFSPLDNEHYISRKQADKKKGDPIRRGNASRASFVFKGGGRRPF